MPTLTATAARAQVPGMGTVTVKIWSVSWRAGRPRFNPGPKLRRLGYKGEDLRHPDLRWFSLTEAVEWADAKRSEAADRRAKRMNNQRLAPLRRPGVITVQDVFERWKGSAKFTGGTNRGKRQQKGLAASTIVDYRSRIKVLCEFDPELATSAAGALTPAIAQAVFEKLWEERGLSMALGIVAVGSSAWKWARKQNGLGVSVNIWRDVERQAAAPRLRVGEPHEIMAAVAAADAIGLPELGDSIMLGVWTGQRRGDRLALQLAGRDDRNRIKLRQRKTGAIVQIPASPQLEARLAAAVTRRAGVVSTNVLVNERGGKPFAARTYNKAFLRMRDAATYGVVSIDGVATIAKGLTGDNYHWLVEPCPSFADFRDQDLRDTAVTWLARAGCTLPEIASITGHSLGSIHAILKHYLAAHPEMADTAIAKLMVWAEQQGMGA